MFAKTDRLLKTTFLAVAGLAVLLWLASALVRLGIHLPEAALLPQLARFCFYLALFMLGNHLAGPRAVQPFEEGRLTRKLGGTPEIVENDLLFEKNE